MAKKELLQMLFGMSPDKIITDALIFEEPEKTEWQMAASQLNDGLSKNQAWAMCQALQPMLRAGGVVMVRMRAPTARNDRPPNCKVSSPRTPTRWT